VIGSTHNPSVSLATKLGRKQYPWESESGCYEWCSRDPNRQQLSVVGAILGHLVVAPLSVLCQIFASDMAKWDVPRSRPPLDEVAPNFEGSVCVPSQEVSNANKIANVENLSHGGLVAKHTLLLWM
jgi:hypothetical protein